MQIKLVTLGDSGVGKSTLVMRYKTDQFMENAEATIGAGYTTKYVPIITSKKVPQKQVADNNNSPNSGSQQQLASDQSVTLQIWDTAGQERFKSLAFNYYRQCNAVYLVYDIMKPETLNDAQNWIDTMKNDCPGLNCLICLICNKADDKSLITKSIQYKQQEFCERNGIKLCFFVSAKTGMNVTESFQQICQKCYEMGLIYQRDRERIEVKEEKKQQQDSDGCCK